MVVKINGKKISDPINLPVNMTALWGTLTLFLSLINSPMYLVLPCFIAAVINFIFHILFLIFPHKVFN